MSVRPAVGVALLVMLSPLAVDAATGGALVADAVKQQDGATLRALLARKADVNVPQPDGATALHWAAYWDDLESARLLMRTGARVDAANDLGVTPLSIACESGSDGMVEALLEGHADPNIARPTGETPLMTCARAGSVVATKALLSRGADVNAKESWQAQVAIMWAASRGHRDVVRALIERGADVGAKSSNGFTPLLFAARAGQVEIGRLLLAAGAKVNEAAKDGSTALVVATVRGQTAFAEFLLEQGADPNKGPGFMPIHWLAGSWHAEITGPSGMAAARDEEWGVMAGLPTERKLGLIKALLAHGADLNARLARNPPTFGYSGARLKVSLTGATPFLLAAWDGNPIVMRTLVAAGADPSLTTREGTTPLMVAAGVGRTPLESTVTDSATVEAVTLALELGGDIKAVNNEGNTALHGAARIQLTALVQILVGKGADVNAKNARGLTPLMMAEGAGTSDNPGIVAGATGALLRRLGGQ